ncbi:MAG: D-alanine--D-alanine ligase [Candidatus Aquicultor sp.]
MSTKVAVLMGGRSAEREISLLTGEQIYQALLQKGYDAVAVHLDEHIVETLKSLKPDVVFIALHGRYGEDGTIQGLLEILDLPYTGSGVLASALGIDKAMSKRVFEAAGIETPGYAVVSKQDFVVDRESCEGIVSTLGFPLVVKPAREGSTIGMSIAHDVDGLGTALEMAFSHDSDVVIEQFVDGVEITVGVLGNEPKALPTLEVVTTTGFYDYETKYTAGLSEHIIPARLPEEHRRRAQEIAVKAHTALGCKGFSRVDIIVEDSGRCNVLEINTIPGMTRLSLFPDAARAAGYEFPDLIAYMIKLALED